VKGFFILNNAHVGFGAPLIGLGRYSIRETPHGRRALRPGR
jgi:hypothetical protein